MIHALAEPDVLHIWETGLSQSSPVRALTVLGAAFPDISREELGALTIGQRDAWLFAVRDLLFGPTMTATAACPGCQGQVEFSLRTDDLRLPEQAAPQQAHTLSTGGYELTFRLPDSHDLHNLPDDGGPDTARSALLHRCVLECRHAGGSVSIDVLPEQVVEDMAARMAELDPQAELQLTLRCAHCGQPWQVLLDIVSFLWVEIAAKARRLLREVHDLARAYGWHERDILAMSPVRRAAYRELGG